MLLYMLWSLYARDVAPLLLIAALVTLKPPI